MHNDNVLLNNQEPSDKSQKSISNELVQIEKNLISELIQNEKDHSNELIQNEKSHSNELIQNERHHMSYLVKASAAVAEYRTKVKLYSIFHNKTSDYAKGILQQKKEISDLNDKLQHLKNEILPTKLKINALENKINSLKIIYKDRNDSFDKKVRDIEVLLFEYSIELPADKLKKITSEKKRVLNDLCDEIESLEINILKKEQEKLIREKEIQPIVNNIKDFEIELKFLENDKSKKEIVGLFSMLNTSNKIEDFSDNTKSVTNINERAEELENRDIYTPFEKIESK